MAITPVQILLLDLPQGELPFGSSGHPGLRVLQAFRHDFLHLDLNLLAKAMCPGMSARSSGGRVYWRKTAYIEF
jgi:hypothetical protein